MNDTDDSVDISNGWLPPPPDAKPYPLRLADALDAIKSGQYAKLGQYAFDPNSSAAVQQRRRLAHRLDELDKMGQRLNGPSNYDSFKKLKDILTSRNGESLSPGRLWDWATYTAPDADKLRTELGIKYGLLPDPRFARIDQLEGSPLSAIGYDVAKLTGAGSNTEQLLSNLGSAADGMLMAGAALRGRAPAFTGVQKNYGNVMQVGGGHGNIKGLRGYESHHMPADSISPLKMNKGPAIEMLAEDHRNTASQGTSQKAKEYRQKQQNLLEQGDLGAAQRMDIQDIQEKFGDRYDDAIRQMIEYAAKGGR